MSSAKSTKIPITRPTIYSSDEEGPTTISYNSNNYLSSDDEDIPVVIKYNTPDKKWKKLLQELDYHSKKSE